MSIAKSNDKSELCNHDHFFSGVVVAKLRIVFFSILHIALIVHPIFNCGYHGVEKRMMPFLLWDPFHWLSWYSLTSDLDALRRKEWLLNGRSALRSCSTSNPAVAVAQCLWSRFGSSNSEPICFDHPLRKNLNKCLFFGTSRFHLPTLRHLLFDAIRYRGGRAYRGWAGYCSLEHSSSYILTSCRELRHSDLPEDSQRVSSLWVPLTMK